MLIGLIDNASATRFNLLPVPEDFELILASPKEIVTLAKTGVIDAGLISLAGLPELRTSFNVLDYGIASHQESMSVKLFSHFSMDFLIDEKEPVGVTEDSLTAKKLLNVLAMKNCSQAFILQADKPEDCMARLLIGNEALIESKKHAWKYEYDLGKWWYEETGLPCVFAQWAYRSHLRQEQITQLTGWIESNIAYSKTEAGISCCHEQFVLDSHIAERYYEDIFHEFGETEHQAITLFEQYQTDP